MQNKTKHSITLSFFLFAFFLPAFDSALTGMAPVLTALVSFLPIFLVITFFALPFSFSISVALFVGTWHDLYFGAAGAPALLASVAVMLTLFFLQHVLANRSFTADSARMVIVSIIYALLVIFSGMVTSWVNPTEPVYALDFVSLGTLCVFSFTLFFLIRPLTLRPLATL